jgi:hypothetical protein
MVECFIKIPFEKTIKLVLGITKKAIKVLTSTKISDHWKEIVLLRYSIDLFKRIIILFCYLITCFLIVLVPIIVIDKIFIFNPSIIDQLSSLKGIGTMSVISIIYFYLRKNRKPSDYSFGDKLLHKLALGSKVIKTMSFDLDGLFVQKKNVYNNVRPKHVFICGLARAGTTIIMRTFYEVGEFRSLTYRDMPFVLMPNLWRILSRSNQKNAKEKIRAHSDGIMVDYDSPEAFEETFWATFCQDDYETKYGLIPHTVNDEILNKFRQYVSRIIASSDSQRQTRYLSKNNNNILRIPSIKKAFPESIVIIPFRNPLQHAFSLLNQHKKFSELQLNDPFSKDYFKWLGHYEFGAGHLPFIFNNIKQSNSSYELNDINYWLNIWVNTYSYLISQSKECCYFLCFEELCKNPVETLQQLFNQLGIQINSAFLLKQFKLPKEKSIAGVSSNLKKNAMKIYDELKLIHPLN